MSDLGNKKIFSNNLKFYMNKNNKERKEVCKDLDFSYSTFADWFNGNIYPRIDKIEKLANYFNIQKSDLIENKNQIKDNNFYKPRGVLIPVFRSIKAGVPIGAIEDIIGYEEITEEMAKKGEFFGLKIQGDSMFPYLIQDDILITRKQTDVENGAIAVVLVNREEATVKRIMKDINGITLIPFNNAYLPHFYSNEEIESLPVQIVGRFAELRRKGINC